MKISAHCGIPRKLASFLSFWWTVSLRFTAEWQSGSIRQSNLL